MRIRHNTGRRIWRRHNSTAAPRRPASGSSQFSASRLGGYDVRPTGNAVNLEDEMLKVAGNQMDYQAVTTLYQRSLGLIKTAMGKR
jgi:flagellar basal-body rod protein FlgB